METRDASEPLNDRTLPAIAVIIAVWGDAAGLDDCLAALERQRDDNTSVIVVSAVSLPAALRSRYSQAVQLDARPDALVPQLWAMGIARATAPIVAITTSHFTPAPDYVAAVRAAPARLDAVGIGGRIDPPRGGSIMGWATYFLRYSAYLSWDHEKDVTDLAGDNASYKRAAVVAHARFMHDGFWEQSFHHAVVAEGQTLRFVPQIRVTQRAAFGLRRFIVQRFRHGVQFGLTRLQGASRSTRLARTLALPLVPVVLFVRIAGRVLHSRRDFGAFVRCLPVLLIFVFAWSVGEAVGTIRQGKATAARRVGQRERAL
jgi:hypothetical protein